MKHATALSALETAFIPPTYQPKLRKDGKPSMRGHNYHPPAKKSHPWKRPYNPKNVSPNYTPQ